MYIIDLNVENIDVADQPLYAMMELPCPNSYDYKNYYQDHYQDYHQDSLSRLPPSSSPRLPRS